MLVVADVGGHQNPVFSIVVHRDEDFFYIDVFDSDYLCFLDLKSDIHGCLRLDCEVTLYMVGHMKEERKFVIYNDYTMMTWLKDNEGEPFVHLDVEIVNPPLQPLHELPEIALDGDDVEFDDSSYRISDKEEGMYKSSGEESFDADAERNEIDDLDAYDPDLIEPELNGLHSDDQIPYIDRAYRVKVCNKKGEPVITLQKGMLFANVDAFREVLKDYVIQEGFEIIRTRNERARFTAVCAVSECEWYIHASVHPDKSTFEIKVYHDKHSCAKTTNNSEVSSNWIAQKMVAHLRADPNLSYDVIEEHLLTKYAKSYGKLRKYALIVLKSNPGSTAYITVDRHEISHNPVFKRFFLSMAAMKMGFKKGCRQFIGLDGCHLKGPYGGVLLSAISLDGNNGLFPLAIAIVEAENRDSWT